MSTLIGLLLLLAWTPAAAAADRAIAACDVTLVIAADGSATATVAIAIDDAVPGVVAIPLGFAGVTNVTIADGPTGAAASARPVNGQSELQLTLPEGVPASARVTIQFAVAEAFQRTEPAAGERRTLPEGTRVFRHAMINTQAATIARYRVEVVFPDALRAHAVREALPKLRKSEAGPRARLADIDGRPGAWLEVSKLAQGDAASLQIELVPRGRSPMWLIAGFVLCVLYLVFFRDVVSRRAS